ncbi:type 1 glutamine amidotransferase [Gaiella sp.]|uniref:type 1 glutamine amidotransferase n=1 Tax=Gaiella sp. TaxID=2663207 RepID=UPI0039835BF8
MRIRVAHLYPDYLNIYADRGNIAVFERRAALRGHSLEIVGVEPGDTLEPSAFDLVYVGGGQDREQAFIAPDLAARGDAIRTAVAGGTALLAVCGGYQLLGRGYRGRNGSAMPGAGLFPHETVAGDKRLIGDVLLDVDLDGLTTTVVGFENHAGRTLLDLDAVPLGKIVAGHGNDGTSGYEGCRVGAAIGTYLHGPLLPRNPVLADWLLGRALVHAGGTGELEPLPDELERLAHAVSAGRARSRGGR